MGLVDYGSSEDSEEDIKPPSNTIQSNSSSSKPAFQKLVDSSNPNKVRVYLEPAKSESVKEDAKAERPAKRAKTGGGAFGGFNALLPAPKRPTAASGAGRGGAGKGMSLRTSSAPGFTREPMPEYRDEHEKEKFSAQTSEPLDEVQYGSVTVPAENPPAPPPEPVVKKSTIFKPLSVSRKPQNMKPPLTTKQPSEKAQRTPSSGAPLSADQAPGASLFSMTSSTDDYRSIEVKASGAKYQPMLYQPKPLEHTVLVPSTASDPNDTIANISQMPSKPDDLNDHQSLDAIAKSLNLTQSQKRQLLGRNALKSSSHIIKVANFNTDAEYAANENLRQAGESAQHQPVRAITGGGKHSLKQLVNSAVRQKDALEESFAEGRRNRKEGASKYGW